MTGLEDALKAQNLDAAMGAIPWDKLEQMQHDITPELRSVLNKSGAVAAKQLLPKGMKISFDQTNPVAVDWVKAHAAELVTQNVIPTSQEAIRAIIQRSFEQGITASDAARLIREHIGILPRHADAVERYRQALIKRFKDQGSLVWEADSTRLAGRYAQQLINYRAKNIARTETIRASNQGQKELWSQAVDEELLAPAEWEREWIADETETTCEICQGLDGKRAPLLNGTFPGGYDMPPDPHPSCRCGVGLVRIEE